MGSEMVDARTRIIAKMSTIAIGKVCMAYAQKGGFKLEEQGWICEALVADILEAARRYDADPERYAYALKDDEHA